MAKKRWGTSIVFGVLALCLASASYSAAPIPTAQELSSIIDKAGNAFKKCPEKQQQCAAQVVDQYYGPSTRAYVALVSTTQQPGSLMLQRSFLEQIARTSDTSKWSPWSVMTIDLPGTEVPTGLEKHRKDSKGERWVVPFIYVDKQWKIETIEPHDLARLKANQTK